MASLQTNNPSPAATGSLTFAKDLTGTVNIIDVIEHEEIYQSDGSLTLMVNLKLASPGTVAPISSQTAFVNVMVFTKINGVAKVFESRKTNDELEQLVRLSPTDPRNDQVLRGTVTLPGSNLPIENQITFIRFRFDKVLVLPPATPDNPFPVLSAENIGVTAYEQNNGKTTNTLTGVANLTGQNFPIGYQSAYPLGIVVPIAQSPGKPTVQYAVGTSKPTVQPSGNFYAVSASLKITLPIKQNWGGAPLRYINLYMMVESEAGNRIVAQILNRTISPQEAGDGQIIINAASNLGTPTSSDQSSTLYFNQINEGDIVSFAASVDNLLAKESVLSDLLSYNVTLKSAPPVITFFRSAELLLPTVTSGYAASDVPGVRLSFTAVEGTWQYVSVWSRLAGSQDTFRMSQQWSKAANSNDIAKQLSQKGFCEKVWNQKTVSAFALPGADSVVGQTLPTFTAFEIQLIFSDNNNISILPAGAPWAFASQSDTAGTPDTNNTRPSQSIPSNNVTVITSIYRPSIQTITTSSSYVVVNSNNNLRLDSIFGGDTIMPSSHLSPYYTGSSASVSLVSILKAVDFTSVNPTNKVIYDGAVDSSLTYAFNNRAVAGAALPSTLSQVLNVVEWDPKWEFTYTNKLIFKLSDRTLNVLNSTPSGNNFFPPNSTLTADGAVSIVFYEYSNLRPIRSRPTAATIQYLPKVYIDSIQESRLLLNSSTTSTTYGNVQLAVSLKSNQAYNDGPYSWNQLQIQVCQDAGFASPLPITQNVGAIPSNLEAEILYLSSGGTLDDLIVAPRTGQAPEAAPTLFSSFLPESKWFVRLRLRYTWSGSAGGATADDQYYYVPNNVYVGGLNTVSVGYELKSASNLPLPLVNALTIVRERPLTLVASVPQPVPIIFLGTDLIMTRMVYRSLKFQLVDAFNNKVSFSGGLKEVLYNDTSTPGTTLQIANFTIPSNQLDNSYSVVVTATYFDNANNIKESPPLRSADIYFEALPNFTSLSFVESPQTITCIASIDLGRNDNVTVSSNATNPTLGPTLASGLYTNRAMSLMCFIPALVGNNEAYAHLMTYQPATNTYQTAALQKIQNPELYGPKTTFLVTAHNNTGLAASMLPRQSSTFNSIPSSWNIISSV